MVDKNPKLFQDPHIDYPIQDLDLNFSDYITKSREIIAKFRVDLLNNPELIIEANTPFEFRPSQPAKSGALLIHGLLDTPFLMRDLGKQLLSQGLLVRSIMLPGHCTVPGALLNIKFEDWVQCVKYAIASFKKEVEQIFLVGFSTGASLSIYHALTNPSDIAGIIMLAPALKIRNPLSFATNCHRSMSWAWPRAAWLYKTKEKDYTKYSSLPFNAIYQVHRLTKAINKIDHKKEPNSPLFIALSYEDLIVSSPVTIQYFLGYKNSENKMLLYAKDSHQFNDPRILERSSIYPDSRIYSFSHICLPFAPDNPHYGKDGDYPLASHVENKSNYVFGALNKPQLYLNKFLYRYKLTKVRRNRLTFNPDFNFMMSEIEKFIRENMIIS